ncbi:hypothetical protein FKG94_22110 [Exilibacterium tricleocarpae]|uniref:WD40 repeat domain-containing protein n=1 Tax=Exilibacterium tricleocarpae TaxID=2591008 RepID=A0A545SZ38_9GAMM|nr:hypothetical protein [Exilibacterium tricleocarpae]TQV70210.1 hypothetical protein FKG94_22110 [Exilibacterium tricleocarpae]
MNAIKNSATPMTRLLLCAISILCAALPLHAYSNITFEYRTKGKLVGLNHDFSSLALAQHNQLCIISGQTVKKQACFRFTHAPRSAKWSANQKFLSVVETHSTSKADSVWIIDIETQQKARLWSSRTTAAARSWPPYGNIVLHEWLDNERLLLGQGCGTECIYFNIIHTNGELSEKHTSLTVQGNKQWSESDNRLVVTGHAGALDSLVVDPLSSTPKTEQHRADCLTTQEWFRYEGALTHTQWLLSRHPCNKGTAYQVGGPLAIYDVTTNKMKTLRGGSPASVGPARTFVASLTSNDKIISVNITAIDKNIVYSAFPIPDYPTPDFITDGLDDIKPIWSRNGKYLLIPKKNILQGIEYFSGYLLSLDKKVLQPIALDIMRPQKYYFVGQQKLVIQTKDSLYFYRPNM